MQLTPTFTSVGVNRVVNTLDWGSTGLIAYGGHWIVCIYDPEVGSRWSRPPEQYARAVQALAAHPSVVSSSQFVLLLAGHAALNLSGWCCFRIPAPKSRIHWRVCRQLQLWVR